MNDTQTVVCRREADLSGDRLSYCLTESPVSDGDSVRSSYSVTVEYISHDGKSTATANDLTSLRPVAIRYFGLIADGLVTPLTLLEVAEDLISSN